MIANVHVSLPSRDLCAVPLKNSTMQCFIDTVSTVGGVVVKHDNVFETVSNEPREKMAGFCYQKAFSG